MLPPVACSFVSSVCVELYRIMNIYPSCLVAGHFAHRDRCSWTDINVWAHPAGRDTPPPEHVT